MQNVYPEPRVKPTLSRPGASVAKGKSARLSTESHATSSRRSGDTSQARVSKMTGSAGSAAQFARPGRSAVSLSLVIGLLVSRISQGEPLASAPVTRTGLLWRCSPTGAGFYFRSPRFSCQSSHYEKIALGARSRFPCHCRTRSMVSAGY
jgi:hypothetical protein